jgi:hypothetical protein
MRKFREYVCDHDVPCAPLLDRTTTEVVSIPPPGNKPCARPTPARHIAPAPAPAPALVGIPVVKSEIGIFTKATAFVYTVGLKTKLLLDEAFQFVAAVTSVVTAIRDPPAPDVAIHAYPVHASPFNRLNNLVDKLLPSGFAHSEEPFTVDVYAILLLLPPEISSPTTTQTGETAPVLYKILLEVDIIGGTLPFSAESVATVHPIANSSVAIALVGSARHEILPEEKRPPEASVPARPPPQQTHADPL